MIVAFAGNRIDTADRISPRFPPANAEWVGQRLERLLAALRPSMVVGAAAPGTDILVLEAAARQGIPARVVLPFAPEDFRRSSVADCGGIWESRYERLLETLPADSVQWDKHGVPEDPRVYKHGNDAVLHTAFSCAAGGTVMAIVVRPKDMQPVPSITDDFVARAETRGVLVLELDPRLRRADMRTAFVVMPYGKKTDRDGNLIDCESTFAKVVVPSLESADLEWTRADQQVDAGIIHVGMLDRLAQSDLVVVDTATENPNAFYELGARHVLRPGATVLIGPEGARPAFNINMLRRVGYRLTNSAISDSEAVSVIRRLQPFLNRTGSVTATPDSPLYQLFDVRPPQVLSRGEQMSPAVELHRRVDSTREREALVSLGDEVQNADLPRLQRAELVLRVGVRLRECGAYPEAIRLLRRLEIPVDQPLLHGLWCQQLAMAERRMGEQLARQGSEPDQYWDQAEQRLLAALQQLGDDPETCGIAGGLAKRRALRVLRSDASRHSDVVARSFLDRAFGFYLRGFTKQPSAFYTGINVLTVGRIRSAQGASPVVRDLDAVEAVTRFYAERGEGNEFWRAATLAELKLAEHFRSPGSVTRDDVVDAYASLFTIPCADDCTSSVRDQLDLLRLTGTDTDGTVEQVLSLPELALR